MSEIVHNIYKIRCHHLSLFFSLRLFALFAVKKMRENFLEMWRGQLTDSLVDVARLAPGAGDVDFASGLLATGVLWPVRAAVQEFDGDAIDAIRSIAGPDSKHVLRAIQRWDEDPLAAARALSAAAGENAALARALSAIVAHFDAANMLSARLGTLSPEAVNQIQAALVNIGGIINIQSVTLNVTHTLEIPPPPRPDRPPEIAEFVGRSRELANYAEMLANHHLAVIGGMAGVGKTALAATLARQVSQPDQIFWHSFREREGIEVIIWKLAGFLAWHGQEDLWRQLQSARQTGGQPPPPETLFDYLLQMLEGRSYLLCFDDLHLVEDDPVLIQLVERLRAALMAGRLSLVITARRVPAFVQTVDADVLDGLSAEDARHLLGRWGLALAPDLFDRLYARTGGNAEFLTLAMNVLQEEADPVRAIDRLTESDDIERYLLAEVDERLTGQEQAVMGAVAVFLGYPGSQDAIEAVLNGESVRRTLRQLADRHLLSVREGAQGREYLQHAMVQTFYYELLSRARRRAMHLRAAAHYELDEPDLLRAAIHYERGANYSRSAQLATQDLWGLINQGQLRRLRHLLEQFTATQLEKLEWINVNLALGQICDLQAEGEQARVHYQQALDSSKLLPSSPEVTQLRARAFRGIGDTLEAESPQDALAWFERGLRVVGDGNSLEHAAILISLGLANMRLGNYAASLDVLTKGLQTLPPEPSQLRAKALINLGAVFGYQGDLAEEATYLNSALEISRRLHDPFLAIQIMLNLGIGKFIGGDWRGALEDWEEALVLCEHLGEEKYRVAIESSLGKAYTRMADYTLAQDHLASAFSLARQAGLDLYAMMVQQSLADLWIQMEAWDAAEASLQEVEALAVQTELFYPEFYRGWSLIHLAREDHDDALSQIEKAIQMAEMNGETTNLAVNYRVLGQILAAQGKYSEATASFEHSYTSLQKADPYEAAQTQIAWATVLQKIGSLDESISLLEQAQTALTSVGAMKDLERIRAILPTEISEG
jgi:ATP/maltotriose-dependent transcriptional regulator MalT